MTTRTLIADPVVIYTSSDEAGSLTFTPPADQSGTAVITVTVEDGGLDGDLGTPGDNRTFNQTFRVTVSPVNDTPISNDDAYAGGENDTLTIDNPGVVANDSDIEGELLTAALVEDVSHGALSLAIDGGFSYVPDENFNRTDSFTYRAHDATSAGETATVTITITTEFPWHNGRLARDFNDDGGIAANDALLGVSNINQGWFARTVGRS